MSQSPRDLLRRHGAPLPRAATVATEVRTDGIIKFVTVKAPEHQGGITFGAMHEWRARLSGAALDALRAFLTKGATPPETLIDNWMKRRGLGGVIGVFLETGGGGAVVRVLFAYTNASQGAEEINTAWAELVEKPKSEEKKASAAIRALRSALVNGQDFAEKGLLSLSTLDYEKVFADRANLPFQSVDSAKP